MPAKTGAHIIVRLPAAPDRWAFEFVRYGIAFSIQRPVVPYDLRCTNRVESRTHIEPKCGCLGDWPASTIRACIPSRKIDGTRSGCHSYSVPSHHRRACQLIPRADTQEAGR